MPSYESGSNFCKVHFKNLSVAWSYNTVIGFKEGFNPWTCRDNDWGPTTGKHLNAIDGGDKKLRVPGRIFEEKLAAVLKKHGLSD